MLDAFSYLLCPKLCRHNRRKPSVRFGVSGSGRVSFSISFSVMVIVIGMGCSTLWICHSSRLAPIMLLKLPIMLWSNAPMFFLLCSNYAPLCSKNNLISTLPIFLGYFNHTSYLFTRISSLSGTSTALNLLYRE